MKMNNQTSSAPKPSNTVKILRYTVKIGSNKHAALVAQVKHFNDLADIETWAATLTTADHQRLASRNH